MRWLITLVLAASLGCGSATEQASLYDDLPVLSAVPDFALTERSGRTVKSSEFAGRVWVANFVFTQCAGPCPLLSQRMSRLQESLADQPDVQLVSFSVDPENDTPEVLSGYAKRWGADAERWLFLTGDKTDLYHLIQDGFKLAISDGSEPDNPGPGIITHSLRFVLVDRQGNIRGYYQGGESGLEETILPAIERLVEEPR
jgi:protein SCO1/2